LSEHPREDDDIKEGKLRCQHCEKLFPIVGGVPRLFPGGEKDPRVGKTRQSFGWEWDRYPISSRPEDKELFLEETLVPESDWSESLVMDAGCGMGRYTRIARSLGAQVVSFDLSDALLRLVDEAAEDPGLHIVQGDLLHPPFKPGVFDIVYSQGVIHHTADTKGAFSQISKLVRQDGLLSVWVYGTPGSWSSFRTNPLRSTRTWLKSLLPLVWLLVWIRQILSDSLRIVTTRLPVPVLYALCHPLAFLGAFPILKYLTFSVEDAYQVRVIENFDWLAPPFQTKHTKEELSAWFSEEDYEQLGRLPHGVVPKIGGIGRRTDRP